MSDSPLIDASTLAERLARPDWIAVDCRFSLLDANAGRREYERGHIPGARYADLDVDLAARPGPAQGRHPLPDPARLAETLGLWGIDRGCTVVAYDEGGGAIASRLWWLLHWLGHERSLTLDGGFAAWREAGLPVETELPSWQPRRFALEPVNSAAVASTTDVLELRPDELLVDARGAARYRGEQETIDPVAGHVPGARNWPFATSLTPAGRFRPAAELRQELEALLAGRESSELVVMCGSGVTACHLLLALRIAGLGDARLYAGSWSEWIRDTSRPIKTGAEP
jgi:thiosulfate/3-mercaptopyruvate sulfurtransferase